ncbi:hypothetical protein [Bradyrhizobium sp. F1.13.3]|uniref:hypothetical protein n=1 Tax=Bradyrhizobium sp. F1.13.3 TaxID=3156351 RepID=UPI003398F09B
MDDVLPALDKKVIYLDQFAISEFYKVKSKTRRPNAGNQTFWEEFERLANRAYLLQQVVFPASDIHSNETIVSPFASELGLAHEMMSGDTSFEYAHKIAAQHELAYAEAYIGGSDPPTLSTDVDDILEGDRNKWLPNMHITASMDYSMFADGIRTGRASSGTELQKLAAKWATNKPTFDDILDHELRSYGSAHEQACLHFAKLTKTAVENGDGIGFINASQSAPLEQYRALRRRFEEAGTPEDQLHAAVLKFRQWPANQQLPTHKIFAYLMAALGWKISSGQRRPIEAGILSDFTAIATYGPYVDAMFVDKECAELLAHGRLRAELRLKAKIFSLQARDEFLQYLIDLAASAPPAIQALAREFYGMN